MTKTSRNNYKDSRSLKFFYNQQKKLIKLPKPIDLRPQRNTALFSYLDEIQRIIYKQLDPLSAGQEIDGHLEANLRLLEVLQLFLMLYEYKDPKINQMLLDLSRELHRDVCLNQATQERIDVLITSLENTIPNTWLEKTVATLQENAYWFMIMGLVLGGCLSPLSLIASIAVVVASIALIFFLIPGNAIGNDLILRDENPLLLNTLC